MKRLIECSWLLVSVILAASIASASAPTVRDVRRLLKAPRGSLSLGRTNGGSIINGVEIPLRGSSHAFFSVISGRKSNYGTAEMAKLIPRLGRAVALKFPRSILGVGNVSVEEGGPIGQSVSHRSGRDVDLGMYALNRSGRRVNLRAFRKFEEDGWDRTHTYRFDTRRNLELVVALLTDKHVEVQWIFVADWLKQRLLAEAWEQAVSEAVIAQMEVVLHQPGDSNPHQDHYHVRIYCSHDDRRHGCIERGPTWDWVDLGDASFDAYVQKLIRGSTVDSIVWRERVVKHLGKIRATQAVPRLLQLIDDSTRRIRVSALDALRSIREPETAPVLAQHLTQVQRPGVAAGLIRVILSLDHPYGNILARRLIDTPSQVLHSAVSVTEPMQRAALNRLGLHGAAEDARRILPFLQSSSRRMRRTSNSAMQRLTGVAFAGPFTGSAAHTFWTQFLSTHPAQSRAVWFTYALREAGVSLPSVVSFAEVPPLIATLKHKRTLIAHTASRLLTHITGHPIDPRARTARNTQRAWRTFWRHLQEFVGAELPQRAPRRSLELRR